MEVNTMKEFEEKYKTWCWKVKLRYENWLREERRKRKEKRGGIKIC